MSRRNLTGGESNAGNINRRTVTTKTCRICGTTFGSGDKVKLCLNCRLE